MDYLCVVLELEAEAAERMSDALLEQITHELRQISGIGGVFYDITNKPPGTIEWE